MKTSPAFSFYPTDFLLGTALFSPAEVGAYIRLLCHQWESGSLPSDSKLLARLSQSDDETIAAIIGKFTAKKDGTLVNLRLERVRKEAMDYRKSRSSNGKKGGRPKKHMVSVCLPQQKHTESLPSPLPSPSPLPLDSLSKESPKKFVPPSLEEWKAYGQTLAPPYETQQAENTHNFYSAKGWKVGNQPMRDWSAALRTCHGRWKGESTPGTKPTKAKLEPLPWEK